MIELALSIMFHVFVIAALFAIIGNTFKTLEEQRKSRERVGAQFRLQFKILRELQDLSLGLDKVLALLTPVEGADVLEVYAIIDGQQVKVENMNLKKGFRVELVAVAKTKSGKPGKLDGEVAYTVPEGLEIVDADGKKFLQAKEDAAEGAVVLAADADGDLGEGVKALHFEGSINILPEDSETLEITFGAPEEIPAVVVPEEPAP